MAEIASKKNKTEEYFEEQEEVEEPDSPTLKTLDNPEEIDDKPYFYEDRPVNI